MDVKIHRRHKAGFSNFSGAVWKERSKQRKKKKKKKNSTKQ